VPTPKTTLSEKPVDRLTRLAAAARDAIQASPEYRESDRIVVSIDEPEGAGSMGGFFAHGFEGHAELVGSLMDHARATLETTGKATMVFEKQDDGGMVARVEFHDQELRDEIVAILLVPARPTWSIKDTYADQETDDRNTGQYL
jgi:hypothetical protein